MTAPIRQRFALSWASAAVPGNNAAGCTAQLPPGTLDIPLPREDAALLAGPSIHERGDTVVSQRGEPDFLGASSLQAYLSGIRWQARASVAAPAGLLSWFAVHDSVEEAITDADARRSAIIQATPAVARPCGAPLLHAARSRVISEVPMSQRSVLRAVRGPSNGGGAVPAPGWLS